MYERERGIEFDRSEHTAWVPSDGLKDAKSILMLLRPEVENRNTQE